LLEAIAGLRPLDAGRIILDGTTVNDAARGIWIRPRERRVGYVPQDETLFPHLSVRSNLLYGARRGQPTRRSLDHVVDVLELSTLLPRAIGGLSGGERRRVALGRALLSAPRILLLDEPLTGLDSDRKLRILQHLRAVRDEFRVPALFVAHSADEIVALCDEVLVLDRGRLLRRGPPEQLLLVREGSADA
jgi:molybdate transport system ATP-binding protein